MRDLRLFPAYVGDNGGDDGDDNDFFGEGEREIADCFSDILEPLFGGEL